jgi:microcystin-dependent protein
MTGTNTTRLALYKPDPNPTTGDDVDVTDLNDNSDKTDAAVGYIPCTHATRPGSPWQGMPIYETDTGQAFIWSGAAWVRVLLGLPSQSELGIVGEVKMWAGASLTAPTGWLFGEGASVARATYPDLFAVLVPTITTFTVTIASPAVVTVASAHGLIAGDKIIFTTTGALPTGLLANTIYYVLATSLTSTTFRLATTDGGTAINTTGTQSGVHTIYRCPWGIASASTFYLPDFRGRAPVGLDTSNVSFDHIGEYGGNATTTLTTTELPAHTHASGTLQVLANVGNAATGQTNLDDFPGSAGPTTASNVQVGGMTGSTASSGSGAAFSNLPPYTPVRFIIKT